MATTSIGNATGRASALTTTIIEAPDEVAVSLALDAAALRSAPNLMQAVPFPLVQRARLATRAAPTTLDALISVSVHDLSADKDARFRNSPSHVANYSAKMLVLASYN